MQIVNGVPVWGVSDDASVEQLKRCMDVDDCMGGALMGDHHLGYSMPIGGVVKYEHHISPSGVGYDIACGNMAVKTDLHEADLFGGGHWDQLTGVMDRIQKEIAFGIGRNNDDDLPQYHPIFDKPEWQDFEPVKKMKRMAANQLGTVGSGNHYVDLLLDSDGYLWVANHFGSRGLGHSIATGFLKLGQGKKWDDKPGNDSMDAPPTLLDTRTELGQAYITYMNLAGEYAYAGREFVIMKVLEILGNPKRLDSVHVHHNFAWYENNGWVIRKGATPLYPGYRAFIGGSMGEPSAIVRGSQGDFRSPELNDMSSALWSAPHGAGRIMSRTKAAGKFKKITTTQGRRIRVRGGGAITRQMMDDATKGIVIRGGGTDEAPQVYKQLDEVLAEHSYVEVEHWLRPIGVCMAGENEHDPYKD